jgi:hypothetical protein
MSSQLTNSKVVVWGNNIGVVYTNVSAAENLPQSSTFGRDGDEAEIRDSDGEVQTHITYNKTETLEIEIIPIGSTLAFAKANNVCPTKGELITITDTGSAHTDLASTYWICLNASQSASNTSEVRISVSMKKYDRNLTAAT